MNPNLFFLAFGNVVVIFQKINAMIRIITIIIMSNKEKFSNSIIEKNQNKNIVRIKRNTINYSFCAIPY